MGGIQFVTNAGRLASQKRLLADQVRGNFRTAAQAHAAKLKAAAEQHSKGTLTPAAKRRMGYPYAARFSADAAGVPDSIINQVSGRFARSWQTRVQKTATGWTITLVNLAPESRFLMGTKNARMRPILEAVQLQCRGDLSARVGRVTRKAEG